MFCPVCQSDYPDDWKVCPKDEASLLRSKQIGKYAIRGLLGVGGMGAVYRAVNPDTQGAVAVKVMNAAVASSDALRQRFQREAAVVAKLRTSHVVKIYDFGAEADGTLYLVMELLDGHALRDEITPGPGYMDLARVHMVMDGTLRGLAAAHKAGIVHRDLKPENVYVADTDDGEVPKLLDFGIARVRTREADLTRTGSLMGTASYMAPEQITAGSAEVGPWSDVYAMGAILYEMLTGAPCFGGDTVTDVLQRVLRSEHVPLATVRAGLSPEVYAFVDRCLSAEPAKRPQDAEAMRVQFGAIHLVPPGAVVPPALQTRPDHKVQSDPGLDRTYGADEVVPAAVQRAATAPAATPTPTPAPAPAASPAPAAVTEHIDKPRKPMWPLALAGVAVVGIGAGVAIKLSGGGGGATPPGPGSAGSATTPGSAGSAATPGSAGSASTPGSAVAPAPGSAAAKDPWNNGSGSGGSGDDPRKSMVHLAAGDYDLGEKSASTALALPATHVHLGELWMDPDEMTLGELRDLLDGPVGGLPKDTREMPARAITYAQAAAACTADGKRLPTELEWEAFALTTPQDPAQATLKMALVPSRHLECSTDGLCDMLGSVAEWTSTDFTKKGQKVVRGSDYTVSPQNGGWAATIHARSGQAVTQADPEIGVRCVLDPPPAAH